MSGYRLLMASYALGLLVIVALAVAGVEVGTLVALYALTGLLMAGAMWLMATRAGRGRRW